MNSIRKIVFLIGGRACGKSTIGKLLAEKLQLPFLDMDQSIEGQEGRKIQEIVAAEGWDYFRNKEAALLQQLVARDNLVIATGGGAILHQDLWPAVMHSGLVVWLNADSETVRSRLLEDPNTATQRPSLTGADTLSETEKIMTEREPLYRKGAHLYIDSTQPVEMIIATIAKRMKEVKG